MVADADVKREAIAAIEEEMAQMLGRRSKGALVVVEIDPAGDGVLLVRTAWLERKDELTPQIEQLLSAAQTASRRAKLIVACAGVSGMKLLNERPDLVAVLEALEQEGCRWVAVCGHERIARSVQTTQLFVAELRRRDAGLYVGDLRRSILDAPELEMGLLFAILFAAEQRARFAERLQLGRKLKQHRSVNPIQAGKTRAKRGRPSPQAANEEDE